VPKSLNCHQEEVAWWLLCEAPNSYKLFGTSLGGLMLEHYAGTLGILPLPQLPGYWAEELALEGQHKSCANCGSVVAHHTHCQSDGRLRQCNEPIRMIIRRNRLIHKKMGMYKAKALETR